MAYRQAGLASALVLVLLAACGTPAPLTSEAPDFGTSRDERELISAADALDRELLAKGLVLQDAAVEAYVARVGARLVPAAAARQVRFRFQVMRDPQVNAFALPNGSIRVNVALLARLENEAQLAQVLGHEVAHVVGRHALDRKRTQRGQMTTANVLTVAFGGLAPAQQQALAAMAEHNRENEAQADALGLRYLAEAGYPLAEADRLFAILNELKPIESAASSIYARHPDNAQRAEQARQLVASGKLPANAGASNGAAEYAPIRHAVAVETVRLKLNVRQYSLAADTAARALEREPSSPWLHYYFGEAYRLMAEDAGGAAQEHAQINGIKPTGRLVAEYRGKKAGFLSSAKQSYARALAAEPQFVPAYRGMGLVAAAEGDREAARAALRRYLDNAKEVPDRRYIDHVLGRLGK